MRLAWHIARKDLKRIRMLLLLWAAVLTGQMSLATIQANLDAAGYYPFHVFAWIFGVIFLPIFTFGLVMGVQQDDSVCDSDAYWITRPISGGLLLGAKLIVLAVLGVFPVVILLPWWLVLHYDVQQLAAAVARTVTSQLAITMLAVPLAALAVSNARFVMNLFLLAIAGLVLALVFDRFASNQSFSDAPLHSDAWSRVMATAWYLGGAGIVINQFITRRSGRSVSIAIAALVIGFAVSLKMKAQPDAAATVTPASSAESNEPSLAGVLRPDAGSMSVAHGVRIRVISAVPDIVHGWLVTISETAPDFAYPKWIKASPTSAAVPAREYYFLVDTHNGRSVAASVGGAAEALTSETVHYVRHELAFSPRAEWTRDPAFDFSAWVKDAVLLKVILRGELTEFPRGLLPTVLPPRS
jgi:hypothetical protein